MNDFSSPVIKKLDSYAGFFETERATYKGVLSKVLYFMALIGLGIGAFFLLHQQLASSGAAVSAQAEGFVIYQTEMLAFMGCIAFILVSSLVNAFKPVAIPLFGSVYAAATGYWITFISRTYAYAYGGIVIEALVLTILLIAVMSFLYFSGLVRINDKVRTVVYSAFMAMFLGSLVFAVIYFVAPNSSVVRMVSAVNNGPLGIVFAFLGVAIGCFFLLDDFDTITNVVERGLDRKYEWFAAYGLVVSVVYLYIKILQLLARLQRNRR